MEGVVPVFRHLEPRLKQLSLQLPSHQQLFIVALNIGISSNCVLLRIVL
jgi:hypothetical protein